MNARHRQVNDAQPETCEKQTHVVPKDVLHELDRILWHDLVEHDLHLLPGGRLELLLNEARPVLVPAELNNIAKDVLAQCQRQHGKSLQIELRQLPPLSTHP